MRAYANGMHVRRSIFAEGCQKPSMPLHDEKVPRHAEEGAKNKPAVGKDESKQAQNSGKRASGAPG